MTKDISQWKKRFNNPSLLFLLRYPEFRTLLYYRLNNNVLFKFLSLGFSFIYKSQQNLQIHTKSIGKGFYIEHGYSTSIFAEKIGDYFSIH